MERDQDPVANFYNDVNIDCKYYIEDQFNVAFSSTNDFTILHLNARSLKANFTKMKDYLSVLKTQFDVIAITETWFNETTDVSEFNLVNYEIVHTNRLNKRGGGGCLYLNKKLDFIKANKYSIVQDDTFESVTVELNLENQKNIVISCIYRTPGSEMDKFVDYMEQFVKSTKNNKSLYVCGDFNVDLLKQNTHLNTKFFLEMMYSYGVFPLITRPTRIYLQTQLLLLIISLLTIVFKLIIVVLYVLIFRIIYLSFELVLRKT